MKTVTSSAKNSSAVSVSDEAVNMLMADHKQVKKLFADFKKIKDQEGADASKLDLVKQVCKALLVHAQLEEEVFYPTVRAGIPDQDLMDEAAVEHAGAKDLIMQLLEMRPSDDLYNAKVTVLSEMIEHHVQEEEGEMFPQAKKAKVLTTLLAEQMVQRQQELMQEIDVDVDSAKKSKRETEGSKKATSPHAGMH